MLLEDGGKVNLETFFETNERFGGLKGNYGEGKKTGGERQAPERGGVKGGTTWNPPGCREGVGWKRWFKSSRLGPTDGLRLKGSIDIFSKDTAERA